MWNYIPFVGWLVGLFFNISLAIPFWVCWNYFGIGETYFYFLPKVYTQMGFWASVGLFTVLGIILRFVPQFGGSASSSAAAAGK